MVKSINRCPYGLDCIPDEACYNCRGLIVCPRCGKKELIPISRKICFNCFNNTKKEVGSSPTNKFVGIRA